MREKRYESPLSSRYASPEMSLLFSSYFKHLTWRKLWIALAKAEKALGLEITQQQIQEMEEALPTIPFNVAQEYEKTLRHDVMAHIHAYADQCPAARGIIHLGATSCFVTDNTDLIQMHKGLELLSTKLIQVIRQLTVFAKTYAELPTLGYTHLQPAQPTTVGKRACLWLQDFLLDLQHLNEVLHHFRFLGAKGATGTQASFLHLFHQDVQKVEALDELIAKEMGFSKLFIISGQTYTRKQDLRILQVLSSIAASAHKFATDLRLLAHLKEMDEPRSESQVGSSAMPYKHNPVRSERICGLSRYLISLGENPAYTAATQWLERSLDDSANRRLAISESFLTADAILNLLCDLTSNLRVHPKMIERHLQEELPFMATENILMEAVHQGKDRQRVHEALRRHSREASHAMVDEGKPCDLLDRIAQDASIGLSPAKIHQLVKVEHFIGRSAAQVQRFLKEEVDPVLRQHQEMAVPNFYIEV
jgi:adenylosuccinate lyase